MRRQSSWRARENEFEAHYYAEDPEDPEDDSMWFIRDMPGKDAPHQPFWLNYKQNLADSACGERPRSAPLDCSGATRNSVIWSEPSGRSAMSWRGSTLKPGEQLGYSFAAPAAKFGHDDEFEFEALGFVDGH